MDALDYAEKASEIFVLSDSFVRIKELIDDEASTIDDIADVILLDPALSATILKLANSSFFNYPGKIDTISKAVLVLGITEVYNLVIAYFTTRAFQSIKADPQYLEEFWEQSVDCALIVKYLGTKLRIPNAERLFILGLLHNLGELVIQQFAEEDFNTLQAANGGQMPWDLQQQVLGFTLADCTGELLKLWQLPYSLVEPIRYQNETDFTHATVETQLLYLSKRTMMLDHTHKEHKPEDIISQEVVDLLKVDDGLLKAASEFCDMERLGILAVLKPSAVVIY